MSYMSLKQFKLEMAVTVTVISFLFFLSSSMLSNLMKCGKTKALEANQMSPKVSTDEEGIDGSLDPSMDHLCPSDR